MEYPTTYHISVPILLTAVALFVVMAIIIIRKWGGLLPALLKGNNLRRATRRLRFRLIARTHRRHLNWMEKQLRSYIDMDDPVHRTHLRHARQELFGAICRDRSNSHRVIELTGFLEACYRQFIISEVENADVIKIVNIGDFERIAARLARADLECYVHGINRLSAEVDT